MSDNHLIRLTDANYADGLSTMTNPADPVQIAFDLFDQEDDMPITLALSELFVTWGQFIDHDLSLTPDASGEFVFAPGLIAPLDRSVYDETIGIDDPRTQINVITPGMDASQVYGSDATREAELRSFEGGRLLMDDAGLMPLTTSGMAAASEENEMFLAGDVRANENTGLTMFHTLFVREHNYWADKIAATHPDWDDQQIFEAARSIVEYETQKITYQEWLPHMLGKGLAMDLEFDPNADGRISTEFSTAAFRFGHTMVSSTIERQEEDGNTDPDGHLTVQQAFFNIAPFEGGDIDSLLRGGAGAMAQEADTRIIDDLNFFLENPAGLSGFSLAALNILRGRDHGLGSYVDVRAQLLGDIDPATIDPLDFSVITSDPDGQADLAGVYATVHDVDLWVGGLAEDKADGALFGKTFSFIIEDQFTRTQISDEGFGTLHPDLDAALVAEVMGSNLGDVMLRNSGVEFLQEDVFKAANRIAGSEETDDMLGTQDNDLIMAGDGNDRVRGREGDDAIYGEDGKDYLIGNRGDDALFGGEGDDRLAGRRDSDLLVGGSGNDRLYGGLADDVLVGGAGDDFLKGGQGADVFVFESGGGNDRLRDFSAGEDVIDLTDFGFADFDAVMETTSVKGRSVIFDLGDASFQALRCTMDDFTADDFLI